MKNLNDTWTNCLKMWKWISKCVKKDGEQYVGRLKREWLEFHGFSDIEQDCFFCDYSEKNWPSCCNKCPGVLVNPDFDCQDEAYCFATEPIKFYKEIVRLNKIRGEKMAAKITFEDGKTVELSQETTDKLRAELVKPLAPDHDQLKVDRFRAVVDGGLIIIAVVNDNRIIWDGKWGLNSNVKATHIILENEVQEIIDGLTKMSKEQDGNLK